MTDIMARLRKKANDNRTWSDSYKGQRQQRWLLESAAIMDEAADAFSSTAGQEWRVPEGWRLVPEEPTAEMLAASWAATTKRQPEEYMAMALLPQHEQHGVKMGNRYRAMLAAAPLPAPPVAEPIVAEQEGSR